LNTPFSSAFVQPLCAMRRSARLFAGRMKNTPTSPLGNFLNCFSTRLCSLPLRWRSVSAFLDNCSAASGLGTLGLSTPALGFVVLAAAFFLAGDVAADPFFPWQGSARSDCGHERNIHTRNVRILPCLLPKRCSSCSSAVGHLCQQLLNGAGEAERSLNGRGVALYMPLINRTAQGAKKN